MGPYSVQMQENANQKNSEYGHFLHSASLECFQELFPGICSKSLAQVFI